MLIFTTKGEIEESLLTKEETINGTQIITKYFLDGELVKQDVSISLEQITSGTDTGKL